MKEVLNIISDSYNKKIIGGPNKVIVNTLKGLDLVGYPYVLNKNVHNYKMNWIHDSIRGFIEVTNSNIPAVIGPNIFTLPKDIPSFIPLKYNSIYLHPSDWCVDVWKQLNYNRCPLHSWPVGIDTYSFAPSTCRSSKHVLVYLKKRQPELLEYALKIVSQHGFIPIVIKYGSYNEEDYIKALNIASFGIWIGCSESQGIGLQEALSTNLPLVVCDVNSLLESTQQSYRFPKYVKDFKATSVPYFDDRCGIILKDIHELNDAISHMSMHLSEYSPRDYILDHLTLEKKALQLLSFFQILKEDRKKQHVLKSNSNNFKIGNLNKLIYLIYIIHRKVKTVFKLFRNYLFKMK